MATTLKQVAEFIAEQRDAFEQMKRDALERLDYDGYLGLHGSHERLHAFAQVGTLSDRDYWRLLAQIWIGHDVVYRDLATWRVLFGSSRPGRELLMDEAERARVAALPEVVTAYRGFSHPGGQAGIAWTLERERAEWFARRFEVGHAFVATVVVPRKRIVAVFDGRDEAEAVIPDRRGYGAEVVALAPRSGPAAQP